MLVKCHNQPIGCTIRHVNATINSQQGYKKVFEIKLCLVCWFGYFDIKKQVSLL